MKNWPFRIGLLIIGVIIAVIYWQFYRPNGADAPGYRDAVANPLFGYVPMSALGGLF